MQKLILEKEIARLIDMVADVKRTPIIMVKPKIEATVDQIVTILATMIRYLPEED